MIRYVRLLEELTTSGPDALSGMLASGITMDYFAQDPVTGHPIPKAAQVLFCSILMAGRPDHDELLAFAADSIGECVLPACRLAETALAKKVIQKAQQNGCPVPRAAVRTLVFRPDGVQPDEVDAVFPGHEQFAYTQLLDSGRFEVGHVAREAEKSGACDTVAIFEALIERQEYDLAREMMQRVPRNSVRSETKVAYDVLQILSESENRIASDLLFGITHGRRVL